MRILRKNGIPEHLNHEIPKGGRWNVAGRRHTLKAKRRVSTL